ncbi:MAG: ribonuclease R [Acidiferrobacterales bacterium]
MSMRRARKITHVTSRNEDRSHPVVIPSREAVITLLAKRGAPLSLGELTHSLGVQGDAEQAAFSRRLRAMARAGQILRNRRGRFGLLDEMDMVRGRIIGHPDGYGFLAVDADSDDLYLSAREMRQVLHGDRVVARVARIGPRGRKEGAIVRVLERYNQSVVGRFVQQDRVGVVLPEDRRINQEIIVAPGDEANARPGQIVVAEVIDQPTRHTQPVGRVIEVLGEPMASGIECEVAIRKYQIPHMWSQDVIAEAERFGDSVSAHAKRGRKDWRRLSFVTIDGEDARDFDDAVYCEREGKGWRLIVAIADVAHYVKTDSAIDEEARSRGNSVYFADRVVPMLPEVLSNGLCSLNPRVDRLCLVCEMQIGPRGKINDYRFYEGVMRSHARLTYTAVAAALIERNAQLRRRHADLLPHLEELHALFKVLHRARVRRGAVDFELPETRFIFDENRKVREIVPIERNVAHRIIEECMLAANVCAAQLLQEYQIFIPYRIHERPAVDKLTDLREFLGELGLSLGGGANPQSQDYAALVREVETRPDSRLIQMAMLRSLSQALYSPDNIGHFALGYDQYAHFTSPIRRYPDLAVHRAVKSILRRKRVKISEEEARIIGEHCSMTERRADEATREVIRGLKAQYMMNRIGDEFDGLITGVTDFGVFVELSDVYVDGLVHITALGDDYFHFDPAKHRLIGRHTRKIFRLGDPLRVRVVRVDTEEARIDLEPVTDAIPRRRLRRTRRKFSVRTK